MPARSTSVLGIDIGTLGVKIVEVGIRRGQHYWKGRAYRKFSRPLGSEESDVLEILADEFPRSADGERRPAIVSLPAHLSLTRPQPVESVSDVGPQMVSEFGENAQWCVWTLPEGNGPNYAIAFGVSGQLAQGIAGVIQQAGHRCVCVDAPSLALVRALATTSNQQNLPCSILDWGWESCTLTVYTKKGPGLARALPNCGLRYLVEDVCARFQTDASTVVQMLRQMEPTKVKDDSVEGRRCDDQAHDYLLPHISKLANEIRQSLSYSRRIGCHEEYGPIVLCGGGGSLASVPSILSEQVELPVVRWEWTAARGFQPTQWTAPDSFYALALSLASGGNL